MSINCNTFKTNKNLSTVGIGNGVAVTVNDTHTTSSITTGNIVQTTSSATQKQQQHPITTTKMGSRRIFSAQFKLQVLDSYRMDSDCKGNQRATARKYGIHRRQIQKWLQCESNLRSSVVLNNNNNNNNSNNNNSNCSNSSNKIGTVNTRTGPPNVTVATKRLYENGKSIINQTTSNYSKSLIHPLASQQQQHQHNVDVNAMSLDITRHNVAENIHHNNNSSDNNNMNSSGASNSSSHISTNANNRYTNYSNTSNAMLTPANTGFASSSSSSTTSSSLSSSSSSLSLSSSLLPLSTIHSPFIRSTHPNEHTPVSFAPQQSPLRIVSSSFLMPSPPPPPSSSAINTTIAAATVIAPGTTPATTNIKLESTPKPYLTNISSGSTTTLHNSPAFMPYNQHQMRPPAPYELLQDISIPSSTHYLTELRSSHELSLAMPPQPSLSYENAFHPSNYNYYDHSAAFKLYRPANYLPHIVESAQQHKMAISHVPLVENSIIATPTNSPQLISPIDLSHQARPMDIKREPTTIKSRSFLPAIPSESLAFKSHDLICKNDSIKIEDKCNNKPWDLSCTRKRKLDNDIDEGISVTESTAVTNNLKNKNKATPPKVIKLFKPYLLSSDDEDDDGHTKKRDDAGKKCLTSDKPKQIQTDPIIWSNHHYYDNGNAQSLSGGSPNFQSPNIMSYSTQSDQSHQTPSVTSSYWQNHGSPVSGYDSASSTFSACSDCNCNDPVCTTKLASPAPTTVSSFSDDFNASTQTNDVQQINVITAPATPPANTFTTKYIVPRRHILEKWSHEEDDEYAQQYNRQRFMYMGNSAYQLIIDSPIL